MARGVGCGGMSLLTVQRLEVVDGGCGGHRSCLVGVSWRCGSGSPGVKEGSGFGYAANEWLLWVLECCLEERSGWLH
jgi:hypothetical protein